MPSLVDEQFDETERGHVWLMHSDSPGDQNAWLRLSEDRWLQISIRLDNSPGLRVNVIRSTPEQLAQHICETFDESWIVRRMNLPGVSITEDRHLRGDG
jgi:hypothetical protein